MASVSFGSSGLLFLGAAGLPLLLAFLAIIATKPDRRGVSLGSLWEEGFLLLAAIAAITAVLDALLTVTGVCVLRSSRRARGSAITGGAIAIPLILLDLALAWCGFEKMNVNVILPATMLTPAWAIAQACGFLALDSWRVALDPMQGAAPANDGA